MAGQHCVLSRAETLEEFRAAVNFCDRYPDYVHEDEREALKDRFDAFAQAYPQSVNTDEDPEWLREIASDLETLGEKLGVNTNIQTQGLLERASEIEEERGDPEPDLNFERDWRSGSEDVDVQAIFDGLKAHLTEQH